MLIEITCDNCGNSFNKRKDKLRDKNFCCNACRGSYKRPPQTLKSCSFCGEDTSNAKFCSRSCAASHSNKIPKRKRKQWLCKVCSIEVPYKRKYCVDCNPQKVDWGKVTLGEIILENYGPSNKYSRIRDHAKNACRAHMKQQKCMVCGYSKHFEVCHIKPIHMHDLDTSISVINSIDNLIALCPNCHWEFDNGLIII